MQAIATLRALQRVEKRAERASDERLVQTYVETGPLLHTLQQTDNALIFGRRGTGKTHTLKFLAERVRSNGHLAIYIDMERLGSTGGVYNDPGLPLAQRATRLLVDVLNELQDKFVDAALELEADTAALQLCDALAISANEIVVMGETEVEASAGLETEASSSTTLSVTATNVGASIGGSDRRANSQTIRSRTAGTAQHRVHLGGAAGLVQRIIEYLPVPRVWVLLDEWPAVSPDLQPLLADMLRRALFTVPQVTVKIAAIPHRSNFFVPLGGGSYLGLEVGGDIFPTVDLDEFVIFPSRSKAEQQERATSFFKELLFKHVQGVLEEMGEPLLLDSDQLAQEAFSQINALRELVRAAEGVPRDAISIAERAALRIHGAERISTDAVRDAAEILYHQTKESSLNAHPEAQQLLLAIYREVIDQKRARAFLLEQSDTNHPLIQQLVDNRILHVIKKGYSGQDEPGVRFDVLQIDYGCYIDLLKTSRAPAGLFGTVGDEADADTEERLYAAFYGNVNVPEDDYRAIRRAILRLPDLLQSLGLAEAASAR